MPDTTMLAIDADSRMRPFFRTKTKVAVFAGTFVFFLAAQVLAVWSIHAAARSAVTGMFSRELSGAAASGASALSVSAERDSSIVELGEMVWRIRESNRFDNALLLEGSGPGRPRNAITGAPVSVFAVNPVLAREAARTGRPRTEEFVFAGEVFARRYEPSGEAGTLVLEAHDPSVHVLSSLDIPLILGYGISCVSAAALAAVVVVMMRFFDRSRREMLRIERLATTGQLASSIAHEVRNPMGTILTGTQLLLDEPNLSSTQRETLEDIAEEVRRADAQLDSFLDLARDIPLKPVVEDLRDVLDGTLKLLQPRLAKKNVSVERSFPEQPCLAMIDRRKLRQAIVNVVLNAMESYGRAGGPIRVSLRIVDDTCAMIAISDDGPGMSEETLQRAPEPFFTSKPNGTGLGLAQSIQILQRHRGELTIDSMPGSGTTVSMRIPGARGLPCES